MSVSEIGKLGLRIERGQASDEELAVVVAVLCSALAGQGTESDEHETPNVPLWRPEQAAAAYRSPYNWR